MSDTALDAPDFAAARRAVRGQGRDQRSRARAEALTALHAARDAMGEQSPRGAAARDGDILEEVAERLLEWVRSLETDFDRLGPARDQSVYRGPILTRVRVPFAPRALAERMVEILCEAALSAEAEAVLLAAVRYADS